MSTSPDDQTPDQPETGQPIYGFAPIGQPQPVLGYFPAEDAKSEDAQDADAEPGQTRSGDEDDR